LKLPYDDRIVGLTHFIRGGMIDDSDDNSSGVSGDNMYRRRAESLLVLLSDSYSEEKISVCDSRSSSCPAYISY